MPLFGPPNIQRLKEKRNIKGLINALENKDKEVANKAIAALVEIGASVVEPLIGALENKKPHRRVAMALGGLGDIRAVEPLISILKAEDSFVRTATAEALGVLGDARAVGPLIHALEDNQRNVQHAALTSLGEIGNSRSVEALIDTLKSNDDETAAIAAKALRQIGDLRAVDPLIARLEQKPADRRYSYIGSYQQQAIITLGRLGDKRAVKPLIEAMKEPDTCKDALRALRGFGDPRAVKPAINAIKNQYSSTPFVNTIAIELIEKVGPRAIKSLVASLKETDSKYRKLAVDMLVKFGVPSVEPLVGALSGSSPAHKRESAAEALDRLDWKPDGRDSEVWYWIAKSEFKNCVKLGGIAVKPLITLLNSKNTKIHPAAIEALEKIGDPRAVPTLTEKLNVKDSKIRNAAAKALGQLGSADSVAEISSTLQHKDPEQRLASVKVLSEIGDKSTIKMLFPLLCDKKERVRFAVCQALDNLGWEPDKGEMGAWYWMTKSDLTKTAAIGEPAVEPLLVMLKDKSNREEVCYTLGEIGGKRAIEGLVKVLQDKDVDIRLAAAEALAKNHDLRAVRSLSSLAKSKNINLKISAIYSLGDIKDARAVPPLAAALKDSNRTVRMAAISALESNDDARAVKPLIAALKDFEIKLRSACAKALVSFYKSGKLSAADKKAILAVQGEITQLSLGWHEDLSAVCNIPHEDHKGSGFHVDF